MGLLRQHLTPKFSEVAQPVRETLSVLHAQRSAGGPKKGRVKRPLAPAAGDNPADWPDWRGEPQEKACSELKRAAAQDVSLYAPDFEGAAAGTNPFHVYVDASKYGIGAGLFQAPPGDAKASEGSHSQILGIAPWATKQEVLRACGTARRAVKLKACKFSSDDLEEAHRVLSDAQLRSEYDSTLGVTRRRQTLTQLRPLAMFSKSLDATQRNWTTWERELLSAVEGLESFGSVVSGMPVILRTDHLNSTLLASALKYPDKILRMLLKIEAKAQITWQFLAGVPNPLADGLSRNPPDRDEVRADAEAGTGLPKTLAEAFDHVLGLGGALSGSSSEGEEGGKEDTLEGGLQSWDTKDEVFIARMGFDLRQRPTASGQPGPRFELGPGSEVFSVLPSFLLPSYLEEGVDPGPWQGVEYYSSQLRLRVEQVLTPVRACPFGTKRWLEEYGSPPWPRPLVKKVRSSMLDAVVHTLRVAVEGMTQGLVGYGEGAMILSALLSPEVRVAAFKERNVSEHDARELEEMAQTITHAVLVCPHAHPIKQYLALWHEALPESLCVPDQGGKQIVVVISKHDIASGPAQSVHGWLLASQAVEYKFPSQPIR